MTRRASIHGQKQIIAVLRSTIAGAKTADAWRTVSTSSSREADVL